MLILCLSYFITTVSAMGGIHICNILSYLQFFVIKVIVGSPMVAHVGQDYTIFKNGKNTVDAWFTVAIVSVVKIQTDQNTSHIGLDHVFFQSMSCYHSNPKSIIPFGKSFISGLVEGHFRGHSSLLNNSADYLILFLKISSLQNQNQSIRLIFVP